MILGKSKIFLLFCLSFIVGVFLGKYFVLINWHATGMAILAMFFLILITVRWRPSTRTGQLVFLTGFLGLTLLLGAWRWQSSLPKLDRNFIGRFYEQEIEFDAVVVREPDVRSNKANLTLESSDFNGRVLLNVGRYPEYEYGDRLLVRGKVEEPFVSEEFSYKDYLARYQTYAVMRFPEVEKIGTGEGNKLKALLLQVKHQFQSVLSQVLPEPHNALALGLILGLKRSLPPDLSDALVIAGVSHIIVISGYNISIITRNLLKTRAWWGRRTAFWLSLLTVLAFVVLTGAEASVIRAAIMGMLVVLALNVGRIYQPVNALIFVATVMIAQNPKILSFDIGFQLSFLATLGLIYLAPMFEHWFFRIPDILSFRSNLSSTLAALALTLPLLILYFDRISLVAPLANVAILWTIPYTMFLAFFTGLAGIIFLPLANLLAGLPWLFLELQIRVVEFFASLPLAATEAHITATGVLIYYVFLATAVLLYRNNKQFWYYLEYVPIKI